VDLAALLAERAKGDVDFAEVKGQAHAKRALEVAAAGGHNILMIGPPGYRYCYDSIQAPARQAARRVKGGPRTRSRFAHIERSTTPNRLRKWHNFLRVYLHGRDGLPQ